MRYTTYFLVSYAEEMLSMASLQIVERGFHTNECTGLLQQGITLELETLQRCRNVEIQDKNENRRQEDRHLAKNRVN